MGSDLGQSSGLVNCFWLFVYRALVINLSGQAKRPKGFFDAFFLLIGSRFCYQRRTIRGLTWLNVDSVRCGFSSCTCAGGNRYLLSQLRMGLCGQFKARLTVRQIVFVSGASQASMTNLFGRLISEPVSRRLLNHEHGPSFNFLKDPAYIFADHTERNQLNT